MSPTLVVHGQLAAHDTCRVVSVNLPCIHSFHGCYVYTPEHEQHTMCMLCDRLNQDDHYHPQETCTYFCAKQNFPDFWNLMINLHTPWNAKVPGKNSGIKATLHKVS